MILGIVSAPAVFADIIINADESCRTDVLNPDTNNHSSSKLSIRSDEKSAKSWIKFDLGSLDTSKTTLLTTVNFTDGVPGDPFTIDVLEALQADTDGIVQFVCHNSNGLLQLATHDHGEVTWRPFMKVAYYTAT
jgi:hypothetical protein